MEGEIIRGKGRPTKYEPWMCDAIIRIAKTGGHIAAMCVEIGIESETTFHNWKKDNPEFREAYDRARLESKALYESNLLQGALGMIPGFNATAYAMIMNNKFKKDYKLNRQGNTEITINNLNLTPDQIDMKIAQKMEKLKSMGLSLTDQSQEELVEDGD